jgi:hypothetical protein
MKPSPLLATMLAIISLALLAACGSTATSLTTTRAQAPASTQAATTAAPAITASVQATSSAQPTIRPTTSLPRAPTSVTPTTTLPLTVIAPPTISTTQPPPATTQSPPTAITFTLPVTTASPPVTTSAPPAPATTAVATSVKVAISLAGFSPSAVTIAKGGIVNMVVSGHDDWEIASDDGQPNLLIKSGMTLPLMFFDKGTVIYRLVTFPELKCVVTVV